LGRAILRRVFAVYTVDIVQRDTAQAPRAPMVQADLKLHKVTSEEGHFLNRAPVGVRRLKRARQDLARGDVAYVATLDGEIVAWVWVSRVSHRDPWSGLRFHLSLGECYAYDLWSLPTARELGAGAFVMAGLLCDLARDTRLRRVYAYIDRANARSQVLNRMMFGFSNVQVVRHVRLFNSLGWQLPLTDRPAVGPCSGHRSGPAGAGSAHNEAAAPSMER
jgi:hypothetical protein